MIQPPSIEVPGATDEELAAIIAAVTTHRELASCHPEPVEGAPLPWGLAARYPDAEFDELRAIVCSTRS